MCKDWSDKPKKNASMHACSLVSFRAVYVLLCLHSLKLIDDLHFISSAVGEGTKVGVIAYIVPRPAPTGSKQRGQ